MTKTELINAFTTETLIPRYDHEDRIRELVNATRKFNFNKSELQKMPKDVLKTMAWAMGQCLYISTKKQAIEDILELM